MHELTDNSSIELTTGEMGSVYLPSDYGVSFFSKVTTVRDNSLIKAYCENTAHDLTPINTQGIVTMRSYAFRYDAGLNTVRLADTITQLYSNCFYGSSTVSFDSGAGMGDLGERSFDTNSKLETVYIHGTNTIIRAYAFNNCVKLRTVTLQNVQQMMSSVFYGCYRLEDVVLPPQCTSVGDYSFAVSSDSTTQANLNQDFCLIVTRLPVFNEGSYSVLSVAPTKLGYNLMQNRLTNTTRKAVFLPWEWYLVYRYYNTNSSAGIWNNVGVWIEATAGQTLPTTSHQLYGNYIADYTFTWYSDKALQNQVTTASTAGTYYGIIQEVT